MSDKNSVPPSSRRRKGTKRTPLNLEAYRVHKGLVDGTELSMDRCILEIGYLRDLWESIRRTKVFYEGFHLDEEGACPEWLFRIEEDSIIPALIEVRDRLKRELELWKLMGMDDAPKGGRQ